MTRLALALAAVATSAACYGPLVQDDVVGPELILPPGTAIPSIYDDARLARQIDENDGVGGNIPLLGGFAAGRPAHYRDLGPAPDIAAPVFVLHRRTAEGELEKIDHPPIFDTIPGAPGYSPFWALFVVEITAKYNGQILASVAALQDAEDEGLVLSPKLTPRNVNCPIVALGVTVDTGGGAYPVRQGEFYYRGQRGNYLDFGETALAADSVHVPRTDLFVLRREGGEPLSEPARGVDINRDGDLADSNDVFAAAGDDPSFSPLCREVGVTVRRETKSIDDGPEVEIRDAAQLFAGDRPLSPPVVAFAATGRTFNCPLAREPQAGGK